MTKPLHLMSGALLDGDAPWEDRFSPITGERCSPVRLASAKLADPAVATAVTVQGEAARLDVSQRALALRWIAEALAQQTSDLAIAITLENGCPVDQAPSLQVSTAVGVLRAYADLVDTHVFCEARPGLRSGSALIQKHPVGVAVGIVPWNVPVFLACMKLGPAIAAGCPLILKPSPENALSMGTFAHILRDAPLPQGMIQMLSGDRELGQALVAHPDVAKVSFTGSTAAGRVIGQECAKRFARCTLELGGKSAGILLDDVDFEAIKDQLFLSMLQNNGQVCAVQSRILVPRTRQKELTDQLAAMFEALQVGDPRQSGVQIGPVASQAQKRKIDAMLDRARSQGATLIAQGPAPARNGAYVRPALFACEDPSLDIAREEVFGPVTTVIPYDSEEDAVALSNDSAYGLSGSVWSQDNARATQVARRLRTGTVAVNCRKSLDFAAPFGGFRSSGIGRELGHEGIDGYLETSSILLAN